MKMDRSSSESSGEERTHHSQRRRGLNADRGVIKQKVWADESASGSSSETEMGDGESDASEELQLAQRDVDPEPSESGDEMEKGNISIQSEDDGSADDDISVKEEEELADRQELDGGDEFDDSEEDEEEYKPLADDSDSDGSEEDAGSFESVEEDGDNGQDSKRDQADQTELDERKPGTTMERGTEGQDDHDSMYDDGTAGRVVRKDFIDASTLLRQVGLPHLTHAELVSLRAGHPMTGPPVDRPLSQADQWKRKYRWPVAVRNIRRKNLTADVDQLTSDYEVPAVPSSIDSYLTRSAPSIAAREAFASALAPTARPLMETALSTFREHSRKRPREATTAMNNAESKEEKEDEEEEQEERVVDVAWLRTVTRLSGHFTDHLLDSILTKNALVLQGIDDSYAQQSWDPLPISKRPIANWRFILEHLCSTAMHPCHAPDASPSPRLQLSTLSKIRDRLRTLYGASWRPEDEEFFSLVDRRMSDPNLL